MPLDTGRDSAYVVSRRTSYVLSVAVEGTDENLGWSLIEPISARIWQYESSRPDYVVAAVPTPAATTPLQNHR